MDLTISEKENVLIGFAKLGDKNNKSQKYHQKNTPNPKIIKKFLSKRVFFGYKFSKNHRIYHF